MIIPTYVTRPLVSKWLQSNETELKSFLDFIFFDNHESFLHYLKKSLISDLNREASKKYVVAVDIANMHVEMIEKIRLIDNGIKIVLFGFITESSLLVEHLKNGYNSVIEVGTKPHEIISIIQKLLKQDVSIGMDLIDRLLQEKFFNCIGNDNGKNIKPLDERKIFKNVLSEKQQMVFDFLLKGHTYKETAQTLGISFYSVNQHAKSIYKKLGVKSRIELLNLVLK